MDLTAFDDVPAPELRQYLEFLLWNYRIVDSFLFMSVADEYGQEVAERLNKRVWGSVSGGAARRLISEFGIDEGGLRGFARALRLFPWALIMEYDVQETEDEVVVTVANCVTQEARRRRGLEEYACQEMHRRSFVDFARAFHPGIQVRCEVAPPDERPQGLDCRWRFILPATDGHVPIDAGRVRRIIRGAQA